MEGRKDNEKEVLKPQQINLEVYSYSHLSILFSHKKKTGILVLYKIILWNLNDPKDVF